MAWSMPVRCSHRSNMMTNRSVMDRLSPDLKNETKRIDTLRELYPITSPLVETFENGPVKEMIAPMNVVLEDGSRLKIPIHMLIHKNENEDAGQRKMHQYICYECKRKSNLKKAKNSDCLTVPKRNHVRFCAKPVILCPSHTRHWKRCCRWQQVPRFDLPDDLKRRSHLRFENMEFDDSPNVSPRQSFQQFSVSSMHKPPPDYPYVKTISPDRFKREKKFRAQIWESGTLLSGSQEKESPKYYVDMVDAPYNPTRSVNPQQSAPPLKPKVYGNLNIKLPNEYPYAPSPDEMKHHLSWETLLKPLDKVCLEQNSSFQDSVIKKVYGGRRPNLLETQSEMTLSKSYDEYSYLTKSEGSVNNANAIPPKVGKSQSNITVVMKDDIPKICTEPPVKPTESTESSLFFTVVNARQSPGSNSSSNYDDIKVPKKDVHGFLATLGHQKPSTNKNSKTNLLNESQSIKSLTYKLNRKPQNLRRYGRPQNNHIIPTDVSSDDDDEVENCNIVHFDGNSQLLRNDMNVLMERSSAGQNLTKFDSTLYLYDGTMENWKTSDSSNTSRISKCSKCSRCSQCSKGTLCSKSSKCSKSPICSICSKCDSGCSLCCRPSRCLGLNLNATVPLPRADKRCDKITRKTPSKLCLKNFHGMSPCCRRISPCTHGLSPCSRSASPCTRGLSACTRGLSPCTRGLSPCSRGLSPCCRGTSPCCRRISPCCRKKPEFDNKPCKSWLKNTDKSYLPVCSPFKEALVNQIRDKTKRGREEVSCKKRFGVTDNNTTLFKCPERNCQIKFCDDKITDKADMIRHKLKQQIRAKYNCRKSPTSFTRIRGRCPNCSISSVMDRAPALRTSCKLPFNKKYFASRSRGLLSKIGQLSKCSQSITMTGRPKCSKCARKKCITDNGNETFSSTEETSTQRSESSSDHCCYQGCTKPINLNYEYYTPSFMNYIDHNDPYNPRIVTVPMKHTTDVEIVPCVIEKPPRPCKKKIRKRCPCKTKLICCNDRQITNYNCAIRTPTNFCKTPVPIAPCKKLPTKIQCKPSWLKFRMGPTTDEANVILEFEVAMPFPEMLKCAPIKERNRILSNLGYDVVNKCGKSCCQNKKKKCQQ